MVEIFFNPLTACKQKFNFLYFFVFFCIFLYSWRPIFSDSTKKYSTKKYKKIQKKHAFPPMLSPYPPRFVDGRIYHSGPSELTRIYTVMPRLTFPNLLPYEPGLRSGHQTTYRVKRITFKDHQFCITIFHFSSV